MLSCDNMTAVTEPRPSNFLTLGETLKGATDYQIPDGECTAGLCLCTPLYVCVYVHTLQLVCVCVPAQL